MVLTGRFDLLTGETTYDSNHADFSTYTRMLAGHLTWQNLPPDLKGELSRDLQTVHPEWRDLDDDQLYRAEHDAVADLAEKVKVSNKEKPTVRVIRNTTGSIRAYFLHWRNAFGGNVPIDTLYDPRLNKVRQTIIDWTEKDPTEEPYSPYNQEGQEFFQELANNHNYCSDTPLDNAAHTKQIPNDPAKYGALAGKYVEAYALAHLNSIITPNIYYLLGREVKLPFAWSFLKKLGE